MAKQRTREQKRKAMLKRQQQVKTELQVAPLSPLPVIKTEPTTANFTAANSFSTALSQTLKQRQGAPTSPHTDLDLRQFFGFDPKLIYSDLTKTLAVSGVLLAILVVFSRLAF